MHSDQIISANISRLKLIFEHAVKLGHEELYIHSSGHYRYSICSDRNGAELVFATDEIFQEAFKAGEIPAHWLKDASNSYLQISVEDVSYLMAIGAYKRKRISEELGVTEFSLPTNVAETLSKLSPV